MKAIVQDRYGPPEEVLRFADVDEPVPGPGEVLISNRAAAVDIGDWLMLEGLPYFARAGYGLFGPKQPIPGQGVAGRVEQVGDGVGRFEPGDEVFGCCKAAFAERVIAKEGDLARRPEATTPEEAAAVPSSGLAALQAVRDRADVQAGQHVLIIGAAGGVGTFAVQIAKARQAEVTAVCGPDAVGLVRSLGADEVIDYSIQEIADDGRFDLIVDLAGNRPLRALRRALAPTGTLVIVGGSGGRWFMGFGRTVGAVLRSPFSRQRLRALVSKPNTEDLEELGRMLEAGDISSVIESSYPLSATADAIARVGRGHARGKTVVTP